MCNKKINYYLAREIMVCFYIITKKVTFKTDVTF